jgi:hypothetical protein
MPNASNITSPITRSNLEGAISGNRRPSQELLEAFVDEINSLPSMLGFRQNLLNGNYSGKINFDNINPFDLASTDQFTAVASFNLANIDKPNGVQLLTLPQIAQSFALTLANERFHMDNNKAFGDAYNAMVSSAKTEYGLLDPITESAKRAAIEQNLYKGAYLQKIYNEAGSELSQLQSAKDQYYKLADQSARESYIAGASGFRRELLELALALDRAPSLSPENYKQILFDRSVDLVSKNAEYGTAAILRASDAGKAAQFYSSIPEETKAQLRALDKASIGNSFTQFTDENGNLVLRTQTDPDNWVVRRYAEGGVLASQEVVARDANGLLVGVTFDPSGTRLYSSRYDVQDDGSKTELVTFPNGTTAVRTYDSSQQLYSFATENSNGNQRTVNTVFTDGRNLQELYVGGQLTNTSLTQVITGGVVQTQVNDGGGANLSTTNVQTFDDGSKLVVITLASGKVITTGVDALGASTGSTEQLTVGNVTTTVSRNGAGELVQTRSVQKFEDTSSITETSLANGAVVTTTVNNLGQTSSVTGTAAPLDGFGSFITDLNGVVQAIRSGQPLPILSSSLRLINDQINPRVGNVQTVSNQGVFTATAVVSAVASIYSLYQAFDSNASTIDKISATANTIASVSSAVSALNTGSVATGAAEGAATEVASQSAGESIGQSLPYVNIAASVDINGKRLQGVFRPIVLDLNGDNAITAVSNGIVSQHYRLKRKDFAINKIFAKSDCYKVMAMTSLN